MTKFRSLVGDAIRFHDTTHGAIKAAVRLATRDDWSPEARAAALKARQASAKAKGLTEGASTSRQHAEAASSHREAKQLHSHAAGLNPSMNNPNHFASQKHDAAARSHQAVVKMGSNSDMGKKFIGTARSQAHEALEHANEPPTRQLYANGI